MMNGESPARILVVGVGGGGGNAVNRMFRAGLRGVELVAMNTDVQVLSLVQAHKHLQLGPRLTGGLGAGGDPEVGKKAAEESREDIADILEGADMVFITAGMGGGTGTGGAPVVAEVAKEMGILTVAIVTRPFSFEGPARAQKAEMGIQRLAKVVDALITISNDKLLKIAPPDMPLTKAFELADEVLHQGVQGVTELVTVPGLINLDFADLEAVLRGAGTALMGIGEAEGDNRTREAARRAISSPLLDFSIKDAKKAILNITGGEDLTLEDVVAAASVVREALSDRADIFFGATIWEGFNRTRVTVIATGFSAVSAAEPAQEEKAVLIEQLRREGVRDDYDIPAFLRRAKPEGLV